MRALDKIKWEKDGQYVQVRSNISFFTSVKLYNIIDVSCLHIVHQTALYSLQNMIKDTMQTFDKELKVGYCE